MIRDIRYIIFFLLLMATEVLLTTTLKYTVGLDAPGCEANPWYLGGEDCAGSKDLDECCDKQLAQDMLSFLVLYGYIIPISLYVTLELQKFFGSFFLTWDAELYDVENDQPARCNSSDLNEELGQVGRSRTV